MTDDSPPHRFGASAHGNAHLGKAQQPARDLFDINIHETHVHPDNHQRQLRVFGEPPNVTANFVNRDELLDQVGSSTNIVVTAIHGIGGVGKSQLAAEYFRQNKDNHDFAAWIDMRQQQGRTDYAKLAAHLALPITNGDPVNVVKSYLKGTSESWLIVFDNAESPEDIEPLRPDNPTQVKTIVTSRHRHWKGYANTAIQVDTFTPEQAAAHLCDLAERPDDPDTTRLAKALGYLPLAIKFAGTYCLKHRLEFGTYTNDYLPMHLDPANPNPDSSDHAIHQLWQQSLNAATTEAPTAETTACLIAALDWSNINRTWFVNNHPSSKQDITRVLGILNSSSLIELTDHTIKIPHNLIATGLGHHTNPITIQPLLEELFTDTTPSLDAASEDLVTARKYTESIRHLKYLVLNHPQLITKGISKELNQGLRQDRFQGPQPTAFPETTHRILVGILGPDHPHTLDSRHNLARNYNDVGRHDEAITLHQQNLNDDTRILGPDHPDALHSRHSLAKSYSNVGRHDEAITLHQQTLNDRIRILGPDHPHTLYSRHSLAKSYNHVGRHDEAITLHQQTLNDYTRILGPDHRHTFNSRHNLAKSYNHVGRHTEAITLQQQTLNDRIRILGPDHPHTLYSCNNLAKSYNNVGRHTEAITLHQQTLNDRIRILGPDHPHTLNSRHNLAKSYNHVGRHTEAITLFEQTFNDRIRILGPDHPDALDSRNNLAISYSNVGRHTEAITLHQQNLNDRIRILGPDHPHTLDSRHNLAKSYNHVGRHTEAITLFEQTFNDRIRILGPDHPHTLDSRHNLAKSYNHVGRHTEAITLDDPH